MLGASPFNISLACTIAGLLYAGVHGGQASEPVFLRQTDSCMGTKWHIALYADETESANTALALAWHEIHAIDRCLTNYSADSELNQFCQSGPHEDFIQVSEHLATVLLAATTVSRQSDGYFDVTIGPVANLWRRARAKHQLPSPARLAEAMKSVDYRFIEFGDTERQARVTQPGVRIDLGGIAKGYAVDRALAILHDAGIRAALVNGGGDLASFGKTPEADGWMVEVAGLGDTGANRKLILRDAALATSGDAWQYLEVAGTRYSHIIDPKTGIGSTRRLAVSVIAPTCIQADSLASALSVMPVVDGVELVSSLHGVSALIVEVNKSEAVVEKKTDRFPKFQ